jgi:hypothetical protein
MVPAESDFGFLLSKSTSLSVSLVLMVPEAIMLCVEISVSEETLCGRHTIQEVNINHSQEIGNMELDTALC